MSSFESDKCQAEWPGDGAVRPHGDEIRRLFQSCPPPVPTPRATVPSDVDRWVDDQMFEEDLRAVLQMMRPHRREKLLGWAEHRTGGTGYRVTVAWDDAKFAEGSSSSKALNEVEGLLMVPRMAEVIASLLLGSVRVDADVSAHEECDAYLAVLGEVARRVEELRGSFA